MTEYPATVTDLDPAAVERFATSVGADPAAGVPPTYAAVYAIGGAVEHMLADDDLAIDYSRMLHGEQEFTWSRQPRVGERITTTSRVAGDEQRDALRLVTLESVARGDDGDQICVALTRMVVRGG